MEAVDPMARSNMSFSGDIGGVVKAIEEHEKLKAENARLEGVLVKIKL
jgi:hypothetical protein